MSDQILLLKATQNFLRSQGAGEEELKLAGKVLSALQKGDTAITAEEIPESRFISGDGSHGYFVHHKGKLGLRRLFHQEQFIKKSFLNSTTQDIDPKVLQAAIRKVVPDTHNLNGIDWQWQAAISLLFHSRCLLSGGPGTGKTTTLLRMMVLHQACLGPCSVALAAPTGKAAHRMLQSIDQQLEAWDQPLERNFKAQTLHQLLGYNPKTQRLRYHTDHPLPYDLVFVDEASMLDVSLTHGLLKSLKPDAKLVLIGDKNQLPAIEAGNVFSDLCHLLSSPENDLHLLEEILSDENFSRERIPQFTELKTNFRFAESPQVSRLCEELLSESPRPDELFKGNQQLQWLNPQSPEEKLRDLKNWQNLRSEGESAMILAATNYGFNSVDQLNQLSLQSLNKQDQRFFHNMPLIITKNQHSLELSNGDVGYLQRHSMGWGASFEGKPQNIPADSLNHWQLAYAISIHKSQGSEYDHVLITLPEDQELELLDRALLYTAVSRAKKTVTIWSDKEVLRTILSRTHQRTTFLQGS